MIEVQRQGLVADVARVLDEPGPHAGLLELRRFTWGATPEDMVEIIANIDHTAAAEYEHTYGVRV